MANMVRVKLLDRILAGTPLAGLGIVFETSGEKYNVNPIFLIAIAKAESDLGRDPRANAVALKNPFGLGPGMQFSSFAASIDTAAKSIASYNVTTIEGVQRKWAPIGTANDPRNLNSNWTRNVKAFMNGDTRITYKDGGINPPGADAIADAGEAAAGKVEDAISSPLGALVSALKFVTDPALWSRIASAIAGFVVILLGTYLAVKGGTAGRPVGILLLSTGLVFAIAGVRGVNPVELMKGLVGA